MGNGRYFIVVSFFSHLTVPLISGFAEVEYRGDVLRRETHDSGIVPMNWGILSLFSFL